MDDILTAALQCIPSQFPDGKLAYLALTSKVEGPFRDALAYQLHTTLPEYQVCREWFKTDLAILRDGQPCVLLEAKAMASFDGAKPGRKKGNAKHFTDDMRKDETKMRNLLARKGIAAGKVLQYTLLVVTVHKDRVPRELYGVIKYAGNIDRAFNRHGDAANVQKKCDEEIQTCLKGKGRRIVGRGELGVGTAFGREVALCYWLVAAPDKYVAIKICKSARPHPARTFRVPRKLRSAHSRGSRVYRYRQIHYRQSRPGHHLC